jgi:hypothetical protein
MDTRAHTVVLVCAALGCGDILGLDDYGASEGTGPSVATSAASSGAGGSGGASSATTGGSAGAPLSYFDVVSQDGPAGYWRLGEAQGTLAADVNGLNNGTYSGPVTLGAMALVGDLDTAAQTVLEGAVYMGDVFGFIGVSPFTVELWIRATVVTGTVNLVRKAGDNAGYQGWQLYVAPDGLGTPVIRLSRWLNGVPDTAEAGPLSESTTTHVVGTYDGMEMCVYLNGQRGQCVPSTKSLTINNDGFAVCYDYVGVLDELAVYTQALAPERITAHYAAGATR